MKSIKDDYPEIPSLLFDAIHSWCGSQRLWQILSTYSEFVEERKFVDNLAVNIANDILKKNIKIGQKKVRKLALDPKKRSKTPKTSAKK